MKESKEYYFWTRSTSEWNCSKEELIRTFDALDEAVIYYRTTKFRMCLIPLFIFACLQLAFHSIWLCVLTRKCQTSGKSSIKFYPALRLVFMTAELVCVVAWICLLVDAFSESGSRFNKENLRIVTENFDGRCTDVDTSHDFEYDFDA